ncbi:MAG: response regulator [Vampirovibrio sp.]|nr:response regulator [Vampirovibrio sp.]
MSAKVLIVDDSAVMRKVIIGILTRMGVESDSISQAEDGVQAVKAVSDGGNFDLILMDWNMPNMLGIDAVKTIRGNGDKTPILMCTTEGEKQNVVTAIQAGANNYLVKPFNEKDLREKLEQMVPGLC